MGRAIALTLALALAASGVAVVVTDKQATSVLNVPTVSDPHGWRSRR